MDKIHSIFQTFSKSEVKHLKHLLNVFHGKKENKLLELIELIEKKPNITQDEASLKLYHDAKSKAFFMTKGRLMERLYDLILLATNLPNASLVEEDPHASHLADLYKKLSLVIALRKRGLGTIAKEMIEETLKDDMLIYYPHLKIIYLETYRTMIIDIDELHEVNKELFNLVEVVKVELLSTGIIHEIKIMTSLKNFNMKGMIAFLQEKLSIIELELKRIYSPRIYLAYLQIQENLFDSQKKIEEGKRVLQEWIDFLKKNPMLADNNRKSMPYIKLAHVAMNEKDYVKAKELLQEIAPSIGHRLYNYIAAKSAEYFALLYLGQWDMIEEFDLKAIASKINTPNIQYIQYVKVCIPYLKQAYKKLNAEFAELSPLFENKASHNANLRLFEILICIETQKLDLAIAKLEALRKHLAKYDAPKRIQAIYKILHQLELQSFQFGVKNTMIAKMLEELERETPWIPFSLEAIRFDTWVRAQYKGHSYWEQWKGENPHIFD